MPVQYTPQFIPTNAQALQGVLSEYQQAYDQNLARELEIQDQYSMIPTISPEDTQRKNQILGSFAETMGEVEKKYNYDRASSAYSKELARKIGELRKNDFWSYNERKKELVKAEQEDRRRLGAQYISKYSPTRATYEDQTALDNYQPMNLQDLYAQVENKGKEWATVNKTPIEQLIKLDGVPIALERGWQEGFATPEEVRAFLATDPGKEFIANTVGSSGFADLASDPRVMKMAEDAAYASLIGKRNTEKYSIPAGFYKDKENTTTSWIPVGTIPVGGKIETPENIKNVKAGEKATDRTSKEYYESIKNSVLTDDKNSKVIDRGRSILDESLSGVPVSDKDKLFGDLLKIYTESGTGSVKEFFSIGDNSNSSRTIVYDYLKENGVKNPGRVADRVTDKMNSWYNGEYKDIKKDINKKLKEGYTQNYDIYIPPVQSNTDTKEVVTFVEDINNLYASSATSGESDLIDKKSLDEFNAIEGDARIAMLKSPGKLPIIRLFKGNVSDNNVLDVTLKPSVSGYRVWSELARSTGDPNLVSDAYFSNINIIPNVTYGINKEIDPKGENKNMYSTYLADMLKVNPSYSDKPISELKEVVSNKLNDVYWKQNVNQDGSSDFRIFYGNTELPTSAPVQSIEDLMLVLKNIVEN